MKLEKPNAFSVAGYAGMLVFFGTVLLAGDDDAPRWLLLSSFLVMLVLTPAGWYVDRRRKRSER
jgi:hypothetical protein